MIRNTDLNVPFNGKTDCFETLSKILVHDSARNRLVLDDVVKELKKGRKCVLLTERKEQERGFVIWKDLLEERLF